MKRRLALLLMAAGLGAAATVPRPSPEFVVKGPGGQLLLSQYRGKAVLLFLFLTTCPHCQASTGLLNRIQADYRARGLQVVGAAFNEMSDMLVADFIRRYQPAFPMGASNRAAVMDYLGQAANAPMTVPIYVFIDRKGTIRAQHFGADAFFREEEKNTRAMVESLLKGAAPAKRK